MKTSLAIVLAVAALTIGTATVAPISSTAMAGGGGRGGRVPTEANTVRNASWAVSCDGNASRSLNRRPAGRPEQSSHRKDREIRNAENFDS